ncbi:hypothetical protein BDR26DRAFT_455572 [Obelidium mucronatum]|nr:hypothetical protein BDR26DRAFT_455572 [Obelidium mucronatum]
MLQQVLQQILQRVPGLLVIALIPFTLLAPSYCPVFFAGYYSFLNLVLLYTSIRTAAGSCIAWIMSVRHSKTDWDSYSSGFVANARYSGLLSSDTMGTHHEITHWIIIPNYKEEINNLRDSLAVLASHDEAGGTYNICLAMEASEEFASDKAKALTREFTRSFQKIIYTVHPSNMPNEMRGKSSNLAWAARYLAGIIPASSSSTTLLTILDADTCLASDYFKSISVKYSGTPFSRRNLQLYTPFSIFDRNSSSVPALVRVLDIAWSAAQLAYLMPGYPFTPALSAYSVPFELAREIGFWDCHWAAMAEDMHMTFKIIVATRGRVQVQQIYSPASQCNIVGRTNSAWSGVKAKTVQLKRHNWGGSLEFSGVFSVLLVKLLGLKDKHAHVVG